MTRFFTLVFLALTPVAALAENGVKTNAQEMIRPAGETELSEFLWINRPIIVFADSAADPRFAEQIDLLSEGLELLAERDVVILTDTDPAAMLPIRKKLRPRGFSMVLVAKDGRVLLRKPHPWDIRELTRSIDKLPARQREIRERRGDG